MRSSVSNTTGSVLLTLPLFSVKHYKNTSQPADSGFPLVLEKPGANQSRWERLQRTKKSAGVPSSFCVRWESSSQKKKSKVLDVLQPTVHRHQDRPQQKSHFWKLFVFSGCSERLQQHLKCEHQFIAHHQREAQPSVGPSVLSTLQDPQTWPPESGPLCPIAIWIHTRSAVLGWFWELAVIGVSQLSGLLSQMTRLHWPLLVWEACFHGDNQGSQRGMACHWLQLSWEQRKGRRGFIQVLVR